MERKKIMKTMDFIWEYGFEIQSDSGSGDDSKPKKNNEEEKNRSFNERFNHVATLEQIYEPIIGK